MSLAYVRAEVPLVGDAEAYDRVLAITTRELIEQATYALDKQTSQREHTDADNGAAARYLLALEQGAASMPLHKRRTRASECLRLKDAANLRHQHKNKTRGVAETRETRLMDAVADTIEAREADFRVTSNSSRSDRDGVAGDSQWLAVAHDAWATAKHLHMTLKLCCADYLEPGEVAQDQWAYTSLELFGTFWKYVAIPAEDSDLVVEIGTPTEGLSALFATTALTAKLLVLSPFASETLERLSTDVAVVHDGDQVPIVRELITDWRAWLETCLCANEIPPESCEVHLFHSILEEYIEKLHTCWSELRDPYHTPASYRSYKRDYSLTTIMERYGLRVPDIDKYNV